MNKIIFGCISISAGIGIGYALGWYFTKKQYDGYYKGCLESVENEEGEFSEVVERVNNRYEDRNDQDNESSLNSDPVSYFYSAGTFTERMNQKKDALLNPDRVAYETFSQVDSTSDVLQKVVDEELLKNNNDDPNDVIFSITPDQFAREEYGYDKVTLYWWELNRILTDEDLDILDVPDIIGLSFEQHIGEYETDMVYIRNRSLETDYEVCVKHDNLYSIRE